MVEIINNKQSIIRVLLIEDNPGDARLIQEMLKESRDVSFELTCAESLSTGLKCLLADYKKSNGNPRDSNVGKYIDRDLKSQHPFDLILLDLSLPDSQGLDTFIEIQTKEPDIPVVVLTGMADERLAISAMRSGAQDYLVKGQLNRDLLVRAMRYAIERNYLITQLAQARQNEQQERELRLLTQIVAQPKTTVTGETFGKVSLRESLPDIFSELIRRYEDLMDLALDQKTFKVDHNLSERLRSIAEQLGLLKAGPRDVVEIYNTALRDKIHEETPSKTQAYMEEARLMVLELMGYMVSFYRNYSLGE